MAGQEQNRVRVADKPHPEIKAEAEDEEDEQVQHTPATELEGGSDVEEKTAGSNTEIEDEDDQVESDLSDCSDSPSDNPDSGCNSSMEGTTIVKPEFFHDHFLSYSEGESDGRVEDGAQFQTDMPGVVCIEGKPRTYMCTRCSYSSNHSGHVKRHVMSIHDKVRFPCPQCEHQSTTIYHLRRHIQLRHEEVTFACDQCKFSTKKRDNLKQHYILVHGQELQTMSLHRQLPLNPCAETRHCDQCEYLTTDSEDLMHHMKEEHGVSLPVKVEPTAEDEAMNGGGTSAARAEDGRECASGVRQELDGRFYCEMCDYSASLRGSVSRHIKSVHQGLRYPCDICQYQATRAHHLKRHKERVHSEYV